LNLGEVVHGISTSETKVGFQNQSVNTSLYISSNDFK